ncbi:MAG: hemerythrin family protein [Anaerolineales bacterium]|nr:hemerythrin family protein [Anaerolineales bacterium]
MTAEMFNFEKEFYLGIESVDKEHKALVQMLNDVYAKLREGDNEGAISYLNGTLSSYVAEHFTNEERFMESIGFPRLEEHRKVHENFKKQFEEIKPQLDTAEKKAFRAVLNDTFSWIITHIGKTDRKYAEYYESRI